MLYVVEQQRRLAILTGGAEVGKSWLLQGVRDHATRAVGRSLQQVDASGLSQEEFSQQLAAACGDQETAWASVEDWLWGAAAGGIPSLWIIDHVDQALDDLCPAIRRLVRLMQHTRAPASVIVAGRRWNDLSSLGDLADLWCELPAWSLETTVEHLECQWQPASADQPRLTPAAMQGVYDCTLGVAGRVRRLCELCRVAAQLRDETSIPVDLVLEVWAELLSPLSHERRNALV